MGSDRISQWARLLLLVALLSGLALMHTVGHPSAHGSGRGDGYAAAHHLPPQGAVGVAGHEGPATPRTPGHVTGSLNGSAAGAAAGAAGDDLAGGHGGPVRAAGLARDAVIAGSDGPAEAAPRPTEDALAVGHEHVPTGAAPRPMGDGPAGGHGGGGERGLDPGAVCLAVLGPWGLAALLGGLAAYRLRLRSHGAHARPRGLRPVLAPWAAPPPPGGLVLARLSVLRI
ncbi:hypothetical protein [Streptomyces sp. NPDC000410]|uniref:hypothetical protein n=1 Tax=Streptomyces sp. NPDC000410 TaxID=3154254 RepID=UPI00332F5E9C